MLRKKYLCCCILLLLQSAVYAQTNKSSVSSSLVSGTVESFHSSDYAMASKNIVSVRWGLSSEIMMDFKLDYHYMFSKYLGIGGGIFLNSEFGQVKKPYGNFSTPGGSISWTSENKVTKPGCSISAIGQISLFQIKERNLILELEPSWLLSIPRESQILSCQNVLSGERSSDKINASGGQWTAWLLRTGLSFIVTDHFAVGVSYNVTNFDSYSTARLLEYKGTVFDRFYQEKKPVVHSVEVGVRVFF